MLQHWYTAWWLLPIWLAAFWILASAIRGCAEGAWAAYRGISTYRKSQRN